MTILDALDYLHDAEVREIRTTVEGGCRQIAIVCRIDDDCGHAEFAGKEACLTFADVVVSKATMYGVADTLTILNFVEVKGCDDAWSSRCEWSAELQSEVDRMARNGIALDKLDFVVVFQDGSVLEGSCNVVSLTTT